MRSNRFITLFQGVGGNIISSIFADGTDGFYFDFSKTDRLFQDLVSTPADGAGENIRLALESHSWGGKTLAEYVSARPELLTNPSFDAGIANWNASGAITLSADAGTLRAVGGGSGTAPYSDGFVVTAGDTIRVALRIRGDSAYSTLKVILRRTSNLATAVSSQEDISVGTGYTDVVLYLTALSTQADACIFVRFGGTEAVNIDSASAKIIPGNHGLQATTAAQPKWQTGGVARYDRSDDALRTTLLPSNTAMTLIAKVKPGSTAANRMAIGSNAGGTARCFLGFDAGGLVVGGVGTDSLSTIKGSTNRNGAVSVIALVVDAGVKLYEQGVQTYSGAKNGSINTTQPFDVGGVNADGTSSLFFENDIYYAIAIQKALTAAEIAAITNLWGTT